MTLTALLLLLPSPARAEGWETFPHGRLFGSSFPRPVEPSDRACSFTRPICVHGDRSAPAPLLEILAEAERAYDALSVATSLPPPLTDGQAGGSTALDIYVVPRAAPPTPRSPGHAAAKQPGKNEGATTSTSPASDASAVRSRHVTSTAGFTSSTGVTSPKRYETDAWAGSGDAWYRIGLDLPESAPFDAAPAFALLDPALPDGCTRRTAIHRIVATAMLAAVDGGETGGMFASSAAYLAALHTGCFAQVLGGVDLAQSRPQDVLVKSGEIDDPDASILLPWLMDGSYGAPESPETSMVTALWFGSSQVTPPEVSRFHNVRDPFFVLAAMSKGREKKLVDLLTDLAVDRAFLGDRSDGEHLATSSVAGRFGRIRFDAMLSLDSLPRRIAYAPLEPTGSTYTWIDLENAPPSPRVIVRAEWEHPSTVHWVAVRVGKDGEEVSRLELPNEKGVFQTERTILELDHLSGLMIVGVNLGELATDVPAHADEQPHVAHGGTLSVFRE